MKTIKATYEKSGEIEPYDVRCIACPECKSAEELPVDEQRWHYQHFERVDVKGHDWAYTCCECKCVFAVDWNEVEGNFAIIYYTSSHEGGFDFLRDADGVPLGFKRLHDADAHANAQEDSDEMVVISIDQVHV